MTIKARLNRFRQSPWGLALILPAILMPIATHLSVRLWMLDGYVYLIYLPLAMMIALLLVYDWLAFPGITLGLSAYYFSRYAPASAVVIICVRRRYHLRLADSATERMVRLSATGKKALGG